MQQSALRLIGVAVVVLGMQIFTGQTAKAPRETETMRAQCNGRL